MPVTMSLEDLRSKIGADVGTSEWMVIDQDRINAFADCTEDHQFIHVDPEAAAKTPFGGTIAHGFLTLSMLSALAADVMPVVEGVLAGVNYGFDGVRFITPVHAGKKIRAHFTLSDLKEKGQGRLQMTYEVTVEVEGNDRPAMTAKWVTMLFVSS